MTTTKAIITASIPTDVTTVYTNSSTGGAVLKSINLNGIADTTVIQENADALEWSYFGSPLNVFCPASYAAGFGAPHTVQLSDDRILLLYLPHFLHYGHALDYMGGDQLHAQICEYQTNKYVAGPITNVQMPTAEFNSSNYNLYTAPTSKSVGSYYGSTLFKAIALSSTVVVCAYRLGTSFRLFRLTITGNTVNTTDVIGSQIDLTGTNFFNTTTAGDFELAPVRGDTTKVIVGGYNTSNWSLQAFNVPLTGAITSASSLFSTNITSTLFHFSFAPTTKTEVSGVTTYCVATMAGTSTITNQLVSFTRATNAFALVGTAVTYTRSNIIYGLLVGCLSTGTNHNAVIAVTDAASGNIGFYNQTSGTQAVAAGVATSFALNHNSANRSLQKAYNWGDERVVFVGQSNTIVGYNSAGVATNLILSTDTTYAGNIQNLWFPFNSRPLYTFYSNGTPENIGAQYFSRKLVTSSTNFGVRQDFGNYFAYGHDYDSRQYAWSETANCWMVGCGTRIYALSTTGVVLGETTTYVLNNNINYLWIIRDLTVTASGIIIFAVDYGGMGYGPNYHINSRWDGLSNNLVISTTNAAVTDPKALVSASSTYNNVSGFLCGKFHNFVNFAGVEVSYYIYYNAPSNPYISVAKIVGGVYSTTIQVGGGGTAGGNAWFYGVKGNHRLFLCVPPTSTNTEGQWRIIGPYAWSTAANTAYLGCSSTPYAYASFGSMNFSQTSLNTTTQNTNAYGIAGNTNKNFSIAVAYDPNITSHRILYSNVNIYPSTNTNTAFLPSTDAATKYYKVRTSKYGATISLNNTTNSNAVPITYVYDTQGTLDPRITLTGTTGAGTVNNALVDKVNFTVYSAGVNKRYTITGPLETAKVSVFVTNSGTDFTVTKAQALLAGGTYRTTDTYLIPAGASVKLQSDTAISISSLLTIVEEV
jgi:hypothetical protein